MNNLITLNDNLNIIIQILNRTKTLTITNSIPVVFKHFKYLENSIKNILTQSVLPKEIIIIISEYKSEPLNNKKIEEFNNLIKSYNILPIIKTYPQKQYAGLNREIAYNICSSDIIIYQDCDDTAHFQRNEIILDTFTKKSSEVVYHGFIYLDKPYEKKLEKIDLENIKVVNKQTKDINVHHGVVSLYKKKIGQLKFDNSMKGQDVKLRHFLETKYNISIVVLDNIYLYNNYLSSWL